ncbi:MAG: SDR family oxidoreductase [Actinobacteria bacterium]|nr:SDR family oxidoreductase [Actinomycetota bacterium]
MITDVRRLESKRTLVTGAGGGIGRATALRFASEGARVALLDVNEEAIGETAELLDTVDGQTIDLLADVSQEPQVAAAIDRVLAEWDGLDVVVANAGIELQGRDAAVDALDLEVWQSIVDVNLTGMFLTCKHAVRALRAAGGGALICTVSPTSLYALGPGEHAYSASKAGVYGLMRVMAADYAGEGIRVNGVMPGFTATPMNDPVIANPGELEEVLANVPLKRPGTAEEVAAAMVYLASDEAAYCIGGTIVVDGGMTAV